MIRIITICLLLVASASLAEARGGRAHGCPSRAWCGCWLGKHLNMPARSLWVARNWAKIGHATHGPQVGAVVVWRHHVGLITAVEGRMIRVLSGNDGGAVRDRWRSTRGVIAYRTLGGFLAVSER